MHTSLSKKLLAGLLSLVMVLSLVAPSMSTEAASKYSLTKKTSLTATSGVATTYYVKGVSKTQYIKVTGKASGVVVKYGSKTLKTTTKVNGTGKTLTLKVTAPDKNAVYTNKLVVKVYNKKTDKLVKTLTKSTKVYNKAKSITLSESEATLTVGDTLTLTATVDPAKGTRSQKWSTSDASVATVEDGKVTAIAAGTATITLSIGSTTAKCEVKVEEKLTASQTSANQITVTGAESTNVADYVVKRGNVTVNMATAVAGADGSIVLTAVVKKLTAGDYTLTFGDKTVAFTVEDAKITSIELVYDYLIKEDETFASTSAAILAFRTLDQFGNDIAVTEVNISTAFGNYKTNTDGTKPAEVEIKVGAALIGSTTPVILVDTTSGITKQATVAIGAMRTAKKAEYVGLYDSSSIKVLKEVTLSENDNAATKNAVMLFNVVDQYGDNFTNAPNGVTYASSVGTTGLTVATTAAIKTINDVKYVSLAVTGTAKAGTALVNIIEKSTGVIGNASFSVAEGTVVKSFSVSASETLYEDQPTTLDFVAIDKDGNEIKDADTLNKLIKESTSKAQFKANKDGSVSLNYTPAAEGVDVLVFTLNGNTIYASTQTLNLSVSPKRVPTSIVGLDKDVATIMTANGKTKLPFKGTDLIIKDQYGLDMTDALVTASGYKLAVTSSGIATVAITEGAISSGAFAEVTAPNAEATGSLTVSLQKADGTAVKDSEFEIKIQAVDINDVTDFSFGEVGLCKANTTLVGGIALTGKYQGATVKLDPSEYVQVTETSAGTIAANTLTAPTLSDPNTTQSSTITVVVKNDAGTEVSLTYNYSNVASTPTTITSLTTDLSVATGTAITASALAGTVDVKDQYGADYAKTSVRYKITLSAADVAAGITVSNNNTKDATIKAGLTNDNKAHTFNVVYTIGSLTFSQDVTVQAPQTP